MNELAVISDIHGNLHALKAVLENIKNRGVSNIICLGDIVGYGADSPQCVDLIRTAGIQTIKGNHDEMASSLIDLGQLREGVRDGIRLARQQLGTDQQRWLHELPMTLETEAYQAVHASLHEPMRWNYVLTPDDAFLSMSKQSKPVCFIGHTHGPAFWTEGDERRVEPTGIEDLRPSRKHVVNVGSVGQPRDGDERACYVIFRPEKRDVMFVRIAYDIEGAQKAMIAAGLSARNAHRLSIGV